MSTRTEKRHPRTPVQKLLTTREDIIAFADFLVRHEPWLRLLISGMALVQKQDEEKRVAAMPKWRQILHKAGFVK